MGPKKKQNKPACNAFYFYMQQVQQEKSNGNRKISLQEASMIAGTRWQNMSPQQKAPFEKIAAEEKAKQRLNGERYTSQGVSYSELEREQAAARHKIETMKKAINDCVSFAYNNESLGMQDFFFIDINIFCETSQNYYVPAELALSKFNLANGVYDHFHTLINPGQIPTGYQFEATSFSAESHQLLLPPDALGESDQRVILTQITSFLTKTRQSLPPIYTLPKHIPRVEGVLTQICEDEGISMDFKVYSLAELFLRVRNACTNEKFETASVAELELEKDVYDYYKGLACEYHETTDVIPECSLSRVKRWGYIFSDYCARFLGIELIPGFHLPIQAAVNKTGASGRTSRASSAIGSVHSKRNDTDTSYKSGRMMPTSTPKAPSRVVRPDASYTSVMKGTPSTLDADEDNAVGYVRPYTFDSLASDCSNLSVQSNLSATAKVFQPSRLSALEEIRTPKISYEAVTRTAAPSLVGSDFPELDSSPSFNSGSSRGRRGGPIQRIGLGRGRAAL